ncbi:MAG: hypothetical protein ACXVGE_09805, partial [Blastococcus sp.]
NRRGAIPSGCRPDPVTPAGQYPRVPKARPRARKSTPPVAYVPPRRAMTAWRLAPWAAGPLIALVFAVGITPELGPAWRAAFGGGVAGTFTSTHSSCGRLECSYFGPFDSVDDTIHLPRARMTETFLSLHRGQRVAAVYTGSSEGQVFLAHRTRAWLTDSVILGVVVAGLAVWARRLRRAIRPGPAPRPRIRPVSH